MFYKAVITSKGLALDAKIKAGQTTAVFTRVKLGDGTYGEQEDLKGATNLKNTRNEFGISSIKVIDENTVRIRIVTNNSSLNSGYYISELALFATDPDEGEILYSISLGVPGKMDYQPSETEMLNATATIDILTSISDVETATIVSGTGAAASAEDLMELMYPQLPAQSEIDPDIKLDGSQELEYLLARFEHVKQDYVGKDKVAKIDELGLVKVDGITIGNSENGTLKLTAKAADVPAIDTHGININTASDTTQVTVDDAWEAPILGMEIAGKSEQVVTTGAQLFDESLVPDFSTDGAQILNNGDGSFTITGSIVTTNKLFQHELTHEETVKLLKPGTIYYSNSNNENVNPKICVRFFYGATLIKDITFGGNYEVTEDNINDENFHMRYMINAYKNLSVVPGIMKPMLYQDGDGTWEPYTGGRPSPSPEYPQEIVSTDVTAVTVTGAQVIPYPYLDTTKTSNGVTFTDMGNGGIKITGTITNKYTTFTLNNNLFLPPGIYTKNVSEEFGLTFLISRYINNKYDIVVVRANDKTFDTSSWDYNKYEYRVLIQVTELGTFNTIFYPMINRGDTALPWEPYQSKTAAITLAEPLRGIGDVRDRIMCKDGVWGVERAINQIDDTGTVPISEALEVLAVPTWEPLPGDTQAALNALTAYKGRTTITVTAEGPEPDITMQYYGQPGTKTNVQSMLDSQTRKTLDNVASIDNLKTRVEDAEAPEFDASGTVEGITDKTSLLASFVTRMPLVKFMRNVVAGFKMVLYAGQIVDNCVTNNAKLPLSAAQGKALMDLYTVLNTKITQKSQSEFYAIADVTGVSTGQVADGYHNVSKMSNGQFRYSAHFTCYPSAIPNGNIVGYLPESANPYQIVYEYTYDITNQKWVRIRIGNSDRSIQLMNLDGTNVTSQRVELEYHIDF